LALVTHAVSSPFGFSISHLDLVPKFGSGGSNFAVHHWERMDGVVPPYLRGLHAPDVDQGVQHPDESQTMAKQVVFDGSFQYV
jgi:hypothetical protein